MRGQDQVSSAGGLVQTSHVPTVIRPAPRLVQARRSLSSWTSCLIKRVSVDLRVWARQMVCAHSVAVYTPGCLGLCGVKADLWGWSLSS